MKYLLMKSSITENLYLVNACVNFMPAFSAQIQKICERIGSLLYQ